MEEIPVIKKRNLFLKTLQILAIQHLPLYAYFSFAEDLKAEFVNSRVL